MSTNGKLRRQYSSADCIRFKATGTIGGNLLVTFDTSDDGEGGSAKVIGALSDRPVGVLDGDGASANDSINVVYRDGAIVPIVCVDSSIACGVKVYNTAAGKVSSTQGSGAQLVGITMSASAAANTLVSVKLCLGPSGP